MGVSVNIFNQKFFSEYKNDVGFVSNLTDFTVNLVGSVGENVKTTMFVDINWFDTVTASNPWGADTVAKKISRTTGSWFDEGFAIGDICDWTENGVVVANITIDSITTDGLAFFYTLNSGAVTDSNNAGLIGMTPLTAYEHRFGLIQNGESFNIQSKVSGNDQGYYGSNIGFDTGGGVRDTNFVTLDRLGPYKDWQTGSMRIKFVSLTVDIQRFEVEHEFTIVPFYVDGELTNLQNNITPQLLTGVNSLKYAFAPLFMDVASNPNTIKETLIDNNLGSVAWFNENFNGFNSNYQVNSIAYEEQATANSADGLLIGSKTKITIVVEKLNGNFSAGERGGVYVSQLPKQIEYTNITTSDLKANFIYDNAINNGGVAAVAGQDFITNFEITNIVTNTMTMTFEVEYSTIQKAFLANKLSNEDVFFLIGVQLGDNTIVSGNIDKIILLADVELYDESPDIPDLMKVTKLEFFPHDKVIGFDTGFTDLIGWNEDGFASPFEFTLNRLRDAVINSLEFQLVAFNNVTQQFFTLDSFPMPNIGTAIVTPGTPTIQQLNVNTTRGYNLATGSQFNKATLQTDALVIDDQFYSGIIGQKIKWQDWIENVSVDNVFFDASKPNNNKNLKSSNYSALNDYTIRMMIFANLGGTSVLGVSGLTNYFFFSPAITVYDYDLDGNVTPIWTGLLETFHPTTAVNLQQKVLSGLNTVMKVTWTRTAGPAVTDVSDMWAIHRIEETDQPGDAIDELSTINPFPTPNRVIPTIGETQLEIDPVSGDVVTQCLVDGSQIIIGTSYNLSARLNRDGVPVGTKETETGVAKETEGAQFKIIE